MEWSPASLHTSTHWRLQSLVPFHASSHSSISLAFHFLRRSSRRYQIRPGSACRLMTQRSPGSDSLLPSTLTGSAAVLFQSRRLKSPSVNVPFNPVIHSSHKQIWLLAINHSRESSCTWLTRCHLLCCQDMSSASNGSHPLLSGDWYLLLPMHRIFCTSTYWMFHHTVK